jgi:hypothetical protein
MAAFPSVLRTTGVTEATPGVSRIAAARRAVLAPGAGSAAATITGASKPGPKPRAMVA